MAIRFAVAESVVSGIDGVGDIKTVLHYRVYYDDAVISENGAVQLYHDELLNLVEQWPKVAIAQAVKVVGLKTTIVNDPESPIFDDVVVNQDGQALGERLSPANSMNIVKQSTFRGPASRGSLKTWPTTVDYQQSDGTPSQALANIWVGYLDFIRLFPIPTVTTEAVMGIWSRKYLVAKEVGNFKPIVEVWGHTGKRQFNRGS